MTIDFANAKCPFMMKKIDWAFGTLTTGIDDITFGSNNTVVGSVSGTASSNTFQGFDTIEGTGTGNTLRVTALDYTSGDDLAAALVSGVQTINIRAVDATAADRLDVIATNFAGSTTINSYLSTSAVGVESVKTQTVGKVGGSGALTVTYDSSIASGTVAISEGSTGGAVTTVGTSLTSTTVTSSGAANTIGALTLAATTTSLTIDASAKLTTGAVANTGAAALTSLTLSGSGAIDIDAAALESTVTTVNAADNSGGVSVALGSAVTQKVTGGSGNDLFTTSAILTTGSVNAGDGVDTLVLGNVNQANTASLGAKYTNFEVLRFNGTLNTSYVSGIEAIQLSGATNSVSGMSATQAANVTARADIGATTFALADSTGTSDVLSLTMGTGTTTAAATTAGALTINGFETLNVATNAGPTATTGANRTTTIASFTADKLTAINLTGAAVTLSNAATTKAVAIDASALVGDGASTAVGLTISGNLVAGSSVTGSDVKDVMNLGTVGSTYTGGAGGDTFAATAVTQIRNGSTYNTIVGGDGTDTLTVTASAVTLIDSDFRFITGVEKITIDADGGAGDISVTTGGFYDTNFASGSTVTLLAADGDAVTFDAGNYGGNQTLATTTLADGATSADDVTLITGDGTDTVTLTASSWVGGANNGLIFVGTGAGNDTITVTTGTFVNTTDQAGSLVIDAGTGADSITITHVNGGAGTGFATFAITAGDSSVAEFDTITGFKMSDIGGAGGDLSDALDFDTASIASAVTAGAVTGYTAAQLTYSISAGGELTFAGTSASSLTNAEVFGILEDVVANGKTAFYVDSTNTVTYVFNADANGDSLVALADVAADTLITANSATTDNGVFIS